MADDRSRPAPTLADLCSRAVALYGTDWPKIEAYVAGELARLEESDRTSLCAELTATLSFAPPPPETGTHH